MHARYGALVKRLLVFIPCAEALEDVAPEGHLRVKRGWGRRWKKFRRKAKKILKGVGTVVAVNAAKAALAG